MTENFQKEIKVAANRYIIPPELLIAVVRQESNFNPLAVSKCGARGLMQIMPATGRELGLTEDEFFDVEKNLTAGAHYLRRQYVACKRMITLMPPKADNRCTDDDYWQLALACYNGGLGYVIKAINICYLEMEPICWANIALYLCDDRISVRGKRPDYKQIIGYVEKIWTDYSGRGGVPPPLK